MEKELKVSKISNKLIVDITMSIIGFITIICALAMILEMDKLIKLLVLMNTVIILFLIRNQ